MHHDTTITLLGNNTRHCRLWVLGKTLFGPKHYQWFVTPLFIQYRTAYRR
jgi:hypothetical protein